MAALTLISAAAQGTGNTVNLDALALDDWALFGPGNSFTPSYRKNGGGNTISGAVFGSGAASGYSGADNGFSWSGGLPAGSPQANAVYNNLNDAGPFNQAGSGGAWTLPAGTGLRRVYIWGLQYECVEKVELILSDASAGPLVDTSLSVATAVYSENAYVFEYQAGSASQTLTVRLSVNSVNGISANVGIRCIGWKSLAGGGAALSTPSISSAEAVGVPALALAVAAPGIPSAQALGAPTLGAALAMSGVPGASKVGSGSLAVAVASVGGAPGSEAVGAPVMALGVATAGIPTGERFGAASVALGLTPLGIVSAEAFGVLALSGDPNALTLPSIESAEKFGAPSLALRIEAAGLPTAERFGVPAPSLGFAVPGVPADEWMGVPSLALELGVLAIPSSERVGTPALAAEHLDPYQLVCIGIPSSLTFGALRLRAYVFERTERTYVVPAERRVLVVDAEDREFGVPPEKRTYEVQKP